jgi:hypothetical protein
MDRVGATETHIEFVKVPGNKVTFEKLEVAYAYRLHHA